MDQTAAFRIHMEPGETDLVVWWAETDAIPGLTVAAPTLRALRILINEAVRHHLGDAVRIDLDLVVPELEGDQAPIAASDILPDLPLGSKARSTLISIFAA